MGLIRELARQTVGVVRTAWAVRKAGRRRKFVDGVAYGDLYATGHAIGLDEHAVNETIAAWVEWSIITIDPADPVDPFDSAEVRRALIRRQMGAEWRPGVQP